MNSLWKKNITFVDFNTLNTHTIDILVIFAPRTTIIVIQTINLI